MGLAGGAVLLHRRRELQLFGELLDLRGSLAAGTRILEERQRRNR